MVPADNPSVVGAWAVSVDRAPASSQTSSGPLPGAGWPRCRIDFVRDVLFIVQNGTQTVLARACVRSSTKPLAFTTVPPKHWRQICQ